jgi:hypothetical protein
MRNTQLRVVRTAAAFALATLPLLLPTHAQAKMILTFGYALSEDCDAFLSAKNANAALTKEGARCYGYVEGIAEALQVEDEHALVTKDLPKACIPDEAGIYELVRAVAHFLDDNPKLRISKTGYFLIRLAFADKFPCK